MPKFNLDFETNNAAFDGVHLEAEIIRILRHVADRLETGNASVIKFQAYAVADLNGQRIGAFFLDP